MDNSIKNGVSAIVEYDYTAKEPDELTLKKGAIITNIKILAGGWWEGILQSTGKAGMFPDNFVRVLEADDKNPVVLRDKSATQNRRCKVIYSYKENKNDELTLAVGDVVEFYEEVEEGWWRGQLNGKIGVFPSNFVEFVEVAVVSPISASRKTSSNIMTQNNNNIVNNINNNNNTNNTNNNNNNSINSSLTKSNSINKSRTSLNSSREDLDIIQPPPSSHHHHPPYSHNAPNNDAPLLPPKPIRELCKVLYAYSPANDDELKLNEGEIITILSKELPDKGWWKGEVKGRVGVFPDNFVALLPPEVSPMKDSNHVKPDRPPPATKMLTSKSPNHSYRKDSFGSRDSLNDSGITKSPSPIISGNVAAHRKSLESKTTDKVASVTPPSTVEKHEKPPRKGLDKNSEIKKSLESLDEKKSTPPPVLSKKPQVPIKKSPSITSVTTNLFSGLKQKVKSVENKLHSHDSADGVAGSKSAVSQIPDNNDKNIICEKITSKEDNETEFGHVERNQAVLKDMRANRAKAPKRRPPSSSTSVSSIGDREMQPSVAMSNGQHSEMESPKPDLLNTSQDDDLSSKPKSSREWEKHKAPWMDELKANQAKKTSPNVEPKSPEHHHHNNDEHKSVFSDMSKSFHAGVTQPVINTNSSAIKKTMMSESIAVTSNHTSSFDLINSTTTTMQQKTKDPEIIQTSTPAPTKIAITTSLPAVVEQASVNSNVIVPDLNLRPHSVNFRHRSISPTPNIRSSTIIPAKPSVVINDYNVTNSSVIPESSVTSENVCNRVQDLETKVNKLEKLLSSQNQLIEDLTKSLKDESDKVRTLQKELEKYAQCVTQV